MTKKLFWGILATGLAVSAAAETKFPPLKPECKAALGRLVDASLVKTSRLRHVLVFYRCEGYVHGDSIVTGNEAFRLAAERTKAFTVDFSQDYADLRPENLAKYDVLVLSSTTGLKTKENAFLEPAFVRFVENGGGLLAIHAGADCWNDAPGAANVVGGLFAGHPWGAGGTWAFKVEDAESPLTQCFRQKRFKQGEEIYQHKSPPLHRAKLHVLLSLDMEDPVTNGVKGKIRPEENDYPVSWVRPYGKGRVFYTSFGHDTRAWTTEQTLRHIFAGLAFAAGDLQADMTQAGLDPDAVKKMGDSDRVAALIRDIIAHGGSAELAARTVKQAEALAVDPAAPVAVREGAARALRGTSANDGLSLCAPEAGAQPKAAEGRPKVGVQPKAEGRLKEGAQPKAAEGRPKEGVQPKAAEGRPACGGRMGSLQGNTPWATAEMEAVAALRKDPTAFAELVKNADERVRLAVIGQARETPTASIAAAYASAPTPRTKAALLVRLTERRAPETVALASVALDETDETLRLAALDALRAMGSVADLGKLVALRKTPGRVGGAAQLALVNLRDPAVGPALFKMAETDADLLAILSKRAEGATVPLWKPFLLSADAKVRRAAWRGFRGMASVKTLTPLLAWLPAFSAADGEAVTAALRASAKNEAPAVRARAFAAAWNAGPSAARAALAPVMALYPDPAFEGLLREGLKETDRTVRRAAAQALVNLSAGGDAAGRNRLLAFFRAFDPEDRGLVAAKLFAVAGMDAFPALQGLFDDADAGASAKKAYLALYDTMRNGASDGGKALPRDKWSATAGLNGDRARLALDGRDDTRWDTGKPTKEGDWFALDLGENVFVSAITLDTTKSRNDTPAGCDVFVSGDGHAWAGPVATCDDTSRGKTAFSLNAPARHVKFVVKGGRPGLYWSIHEIEVTSGVDKARLGQIANVAATLR